MSGLYLGIDVGTQGTKALVVDEESGDVVGRGARSYGLIPGLPPGAAEQHPDTWIDAVRGAACDALAEVDTARVRGVGVSGQQHGLVALDAGDRPVRPAKLWCDTATAAEARALSEELGRHVPAGYTAPKVRWMAVHEPDRWARVRRVLLPHDWVNLRLTGRATTEAGDASGTGFFDPARRDFDHEVAARVDPRLPELLPPLVGPGEPAGELDRAGAELLGLAPGIPVAAGGGDNMMSAIGSGATRPGVMVVSLGTSGTAFTFADRPVVDPEGLVAAFCDSTGGWLPLLCVMNATGVTEEVRAAFDGATHESLARAAEAVPAGCDGLLLVPYLAGERVPDLPDATAALLGWRAGMLRPGVLYRAALEGTTLNLALGIERMVALGCATESVRLVGGGARSDLWSQIVADVLEVPVVRLAEPDSAALGAAIQAAWTVRRTAGEDVSADAVTRAFVRLEGAPVEPRAARFAAYRDARRRLREATARLYGPVPVE